MRFDEVRNLLKPGHLAVETGVVHHDGGSRTVCALTRMPRARAKMVEWWFGWLGGTDRYKLWHPTDHLLSDWENRTGKTHVGSSHLVHDYLGGSEGPICTQRIPFRDPAEFSDTAQNAQLDGVAICARIGLLDAAVILGLMTHFVRNTLQGCEMRSRRFRGHVESRDPAHPIPPEAARALRHQNVTTDLARRPHRHPTEAMSYLGECLPILHRQVTQDQII